jgi:hypothetical protein
LNSACTAGTDSIKEVPLAVFPGSRPTHLADTGRT